LIVILFLYKLHNLYKSIDRLCSFRYYITCVHYYAGYGKIQLNSSFQQKEACRMRHMVKMICLALVGLLLAGCSALEPAPTPANTVGASATPMPSLTAVSTAPVRITFEKPAGEKFFGTLHGQGETAIILANMTEGGQRQWDPFIQAVDQQKFTVVTFDYLQADYVGAFLETNIVLKRLSETGYKRVICIGASLGVTSCASIAGQPEIIGMVLIAGPNNAGSLAKTAYPKLFIAGASDEWAASTQAVYEQAGEPKDLVLFPDNSAHGTQLFYSQDRDKFLKLLIDFVDKL
jgi:hypothetical protein